MKKTIIYIRVSTQRQVNEGHSLDNQLERLKMYCKMNELKNIEIITDAGISGSTIKKRIGFQKMINEVKTNNVSDIVVYSLSRFARSVKDTASTIELLNKHSVNFHSLSEKIDTSTSTGRFFINILSAMNQLESEQTAERIKSVLSNLKEKGKRIGGIPYGYTVKDKNLIINKKEMKTVKLIKEMKSDNFTYKQICNELKEKKITNRNNSLDWQASTVFRIVNYK